jgi:hypothetical protein
MGRMKITDLTLANDAIFKAGTLISNCKIFAGKSDPADDQRAFQMLIDAAEHQNSALQHLCDSIKRLEGDSKRE